MYHEKNIIIVQYCNIKFVKKNKKKKIKKK
jgi:hypothetical protein